MRLASRQATRRCLAPSLDRPRRPSESAAMSDESPPAAAPASRRRAREEAGKLVGDDPLPRHPVRRHPDRPQLRLRAVHDPVRIDAAQSDDRRLSVRDEMALWLVALLDAVRAGLLLGPDLGPAAGPRRHRRVPQSGPRELRHRQAGDRPARRPDRGAGRRRHPERPAAAARADRRLCDAGQRRTANAGSSATTPPPAWRPGRAGRNATIPAIARRCPRGAATSARSGPHPARRFRRRSSCRKASCS